MLMFRSPQAEQNLSANGYALLVNAVLGAGLKNGVLMKTTNKPILKRGRSPAHLQVGLNYYRANEVGPPSAGQVTSEARGNFAVDPNDLVVKVPTLVIWGEKDTAPLTQNLDGLDNFVPQLTIKRIPEGSHWVIHEKRDEVNAAIRDFIRH
jgi:pimeloyl-ACP methyl ester carboxylesterase